MSDNNIAPRRDPKAIHGCHNMFSPIRVHITSVGANGLAQGLMNVLELQLKDYGFTAEFNYKPCEIPAYTGVKHMHVSYEMHHVEDNAVRKSIVRDTKRYIAQYDIDYLVS